MRFITYRRKLDEAARIRSGMDKADVACPECGAFLMPVDAHAATCPAGHGRVRLIARRLLNARIEFLETVILCEGEIVDHGEHVHFEWLDSDMSYKCAPVASVPVHRFKRGQVHRYIYTLVEQGRHVAAVRISDVHLPQSMEPREPPPPPPPPPRKRKRGKR